MKTTAGLLVAAALIPLLAGCTGLGRGPEAASPVGVSAAALETGHFYAFAHRGGDLVLAVPSNGSAEVVLYGSDDARLGRVGLGSQRAAGRFVLDSVPAGELVIETLALNGTLDVRSGGEAVHQFFDLPRRIERHVLLEQAGGPLPSVVLVNQAAQKAHRTITLQRAPSSLRLLVRGDYQDLAVTVVGRVGTVLDSTSSGTPLGTPGLGAFGEVSSETHSENIRDGELNATVTASSFQGVLLLEATSFSRARPLQGGAETATPRPRFSYGTLPDHPVSFTVRQGAKTLSLWTDGGAPTGKPACTGANCTVAAWVALFGPDDARVATVAVPTNGTLSVPVHQAGAWVAILLNGHALIGADQTPGDFELHEIGVHQSSVPDAAAGGTNGSYGQSRQPVAGDGVPFQLTPKEMAGGGGTLPTDPFPNFAGGCPTPASTLLQDGEAIGNWGYSSLLEKLDGAEATRLLDGGALSLVHDDFGPGCTRMGLVIDSYQR